MLRFIIYCFSVTFFLGLITWSGSEQALWNLPTYWIEILFFILFITVVIFYNLTKLRLRHPELFAQFYLLSIVLKMVGGLTLLFFIVWDAPPAAIGNVTLFIVSYLTLTSLEVFFLRSKPEK